MSGDVVLAIIGTSAGAGSVVGAGVALWWRDRIPYGQRQLLRHCYVYVDDRIGATKTENIRRANRRHHLYRRLWFLPKDTRVGIATFFWPTPQLGTGTAALPSTKRMGRYITLEFRAGAERPYRLWDIIAVIIRPTSEVDVHVGGFEASLVRWVAWALRTLPDQLEVEAHPELGYWRVVRKAPAPEFRPTVPVGVNADA